jgi:hydroxymethylpyrimidine pyrophosphatase-like HAD family hydrolase
MKKTIACDLDGTLAKHQPGKFDKDKIGDPVPAMVDKVRRAIASGHEVRIFTARATDKANIPPIKKWLKKHDLPALEITCNKCPEITDFWDDRARRVKRNVGDV